MTSIYKIKNSNGLFSGGGMYIRWSKKGKVWNGLGPLKNHLRLVTPSDYRNAVIVCYELSEFEVGELSCQTMIEEMEAKDKIKLAEREKRWEELRRQSRLNEYNRLKKEFE
jgi:hypothetical protein